MNPRAEQFLRNVRLEESRVQYPEDVVFFCGGVIDPSDLRFASLRDFIFANRAIVLEGKRIILAEKAAEAFDSRVYEDLMDFERFIASISRIVLLVSESPGSIAELGAFSQIFEISSLDFLKRFQSLYLQQRMLYLLYGESHQIYLK